MLSLCVLLLLTLHVTARRQLDRSVAHPDAEEPVQATEQAWLKRTLEFCLSGDKEVACDKETIIHIQDAVYNRKAGSCSPLAETDQKSCTAQATGMIRDLCEGNQTCMLKSKDHITCDTKPFTKMRLVVLCEAGTPTDAEDEGPLTEVVRHVQVVEDAVTKEIDDPDTPTSSVTTTLPVIRGFEDEKVVQAEVKKEIGNPDVVSVELIPCYRWTRTQKIFKGDFFSRLTNCGKKESCFKLSFPGGRVFADAKSPPSTQDLASGELTEVKPGFLGALLVYFRGNVLVKNDYNTWGICLPTTEGLQYATSVLRSLRVSQAA